MFYSLRERFLLEAAPVAGTVGCGSILAGSGVISTAPLATGGSTAAMINSVSGIVATLGPGGAVICGAALCLLTALMAKKLITDISEEDSPATPVAVVG